MVRVPVENTPTGTEAPTERGVKEAKSKIKEIIETAIAKESLPGGFQAKYKV